MTLEAITPLIDYVEDGSTLAHAIPFQFVAPTDIVCSRILAGVVTDLTLGTDFTVSGGAGSTGTVTKSSGGVAGTTFRIERMTTREQPLDLIAGDSFPVDSVEAEFDRLAAVNQEQDVFAADLEARAFRVIEGQTLSEFDKTKFAGKFFAGDAGGNPFPSDGLGGADASLRSDLAAANGYLLVGGTRKKLAANVTYYVAPTGSDANDGLSAGAPFHTIQKAIDTVYEALDLNGFQVTISVAAGTYTGQLTATGKLTGSSGAQPLKIIGDEVTPSNVLLSINSGTALTLSLGAYVMIAGVKTVVTTAGDGWHVQSGSLLEHRNCEFGNVTGDMVICTGSSLVNAIANDNATKGVTTVSGDATTFCHSTGKGRIAFTDQQINFVGARIFSTYLWGINDATIGIDGTTITGSRPNGNTTVHDSSLLNTYSLVNAGGWGYLGVGSVIIEDSSIITADGFPTRTFYVRPDATSDQNDGLENTVGRAFKTIQGCLDFVAKLPFNPANFPTPANVTIQLADGTYAGCSLRDVPYFGGTLRGNPAAPANVIINGSNDGIIGLAIKTPWVLDGLKIAAAAGQGLRLEKNTVVTFQNLNFGVCSGSHISAKYGAIAIATGNYSISGAAQIHADALYGGRIDISGFTVTITGTPNLIFARATDLGLVRAAGTIYSGAATGTRYQTTGNSVIDTNGAGATGLPGNGSGSATTGGQYI